MKLYVGRARSPDQFVADVLVTVPDMDWEIERARKYRDSFDYGCVDTIASPVLEFDADVYASLWYESELAQVMFEDRGNVPAYKGNKIATWALSEVDEIEDRLNELDGILVFDAGFSNDSGKSCFNPIPRIRIGLDTGNISFHLFSEDRSRYWVLLPDWEMQE